MVTWEEEPAGRRQLMTWREALAGARTIEEHFSMTDGDLRVLYTVAMNTGPGSVIVELGVHRGRTAAVLAYVAFHRKAFYFGVDDFSAGESPGVVRANLDHLVLPYTLLVGRTSEVPWRTPIDLLLIDAEHDEANVQADIARWLPFVKPGGWVAFDDWDETIPQPSPQPPWYAPALYGAPATAGWDEVRGPDRLMCRRRPL